MNTGIKENKKMCVFLSHGDIFRHEISSFMRSHLDIDGKIYKREAIGYNIAYTNDYGETVNNYTKYDLYVYDMDLPKMSDEGILQIFEICKSLEFGNYFNIPERVYFKV